MPAKDKKHVSTTIEKKDVAVVEKWLDKEGRSMGWFMRKAFHLMKKELGIK